jgi:protein-tyrosine phosphatase
MPQQADHSANPEFEYNQITDLIYIGTNACCITHYSDFLQDKGITVDLSMEGERMDDATGAEYFLWLPTVDHTAPDMKKLRVGVAAMQKWIEMEEKMYVHCRNGHGRAPTMVAAYFISQGMSVDEAIKKIANQRPSIHLEDVQREQLQRFSEKYT